MTETQDNFLLSPPAQALKPSDALRLHEDEAYERFKAIRWGWTDGRPNCPSCGFDRIYEIRRRSFECAKCKRHFTSTSGTSFHAHKVTLRDLLSTVSFRLHHRASPIVISREVGLSYSGAYRLSKRLVLFGNTAIRTRERMWPFNEKPRPNAPGGDLVAKVNAVIPRTLEDQVRGDVAQDMILGVLSGDLAETDLARNVHKYITKYYKGYNSRFIHISFDAPVPFTDGQRWDDKISEEYYRYRMELVNS